VKIVAKNEDLCTGCGTCEITCSRTWFNEESADKSCIRVNAEITPPAITVCNQCGECISVCPSAAIARDNRGIVKINRDMCVGCYICVGFCPSLVMRRHPEMTEPFKCVACGACTRACPTNAIFLEEVKQEVHA
jgi:Fe-S-cluster-containing hydrogenase component 2